MDDQRNPDLFSRILQCLAGATGAALATVIALRGSGPREPGAMMLIGPDGETSGTVGGGLLEAEVMQRARAMRRTGRPEIMVFSMTDREASENGMICGGTAEILLEPLYGTDTYYKAAWAGAGQARREGRRSWLVRSLQQSTGQVEVGIGVAGEGRGLNISGSLDPSIIDAGRLEKACCRRPVLMDFGGIRHFVQPLPVAQTVFIFGAGHIAKELAGMCELLEFRTVVIDDREEFARPSRFPAAREVLAVSSFPAVFKQLPIGEDSFIVIVTRGHIHDGDVLSRALKTNARYIGMIASRRKREIIFRSLLDQGFSAADLKRVASPIGIDIGARTPAEIAVSIAAQLISVRAGMERAPNG